MIKRKPHILKSTAALTDCDQGSLFSMFVMIFPHLHIKNEAAIP